MFQIKVKPLESKESEVVLVNDNERLATALRDYRIYSMACSGRPFLGSTRQFSDEMVYLSPGDIYQLSGEIGDYNVAAYFLDAILLKSYNTNPSNDFILKKVPKEFGKNFKGTKDKPIKLTIDDTVKDDILNESSHIICQINGDLHGTIKKSEDLFLKVDGYANDISSLQRSFVIVDGMLGDWCGSYCEDSIMFAKGAGIRFGDEASNSIFFLEKDAGNNVGSDAKNCYFSLQNAGHDIGKSSSDCVFHVNSFMGHFQNRTSTLYVAKIDKSQLYYCNNVILTDKLIFDKLSGTIQKKFKLADAHGRVIECK